VASSSIAGLGNRVLRPAGWRTPAEQKPGHLLHILKAKERIETGFMAEVKVMICQYNCSISQW
jgi:hypothetical protein